MIMMPSSELWCTDLGLFARAWKGLHSKFGAQQAEKLETRSLSCMFARSPGLGMSQGSTLHKRRVQEHEQEAVDRADGRAYRLTQERSREALGGFHDDHNRRAQGGRGGPDSGLWEILRPRSEGQRRQESAERGEDEDPSLQGSGVQGGQISQGFDLVVSWTTGFPSRLRPGNFLMHRSACKDDSANFRCRGFSEVRPLAHR